MSRIAATSQASRSVVPATASSTTSFTNTGPAAWKPTPTTEDTTDSTTSRRCCQQAALSRRIQPGEVRDT